MLKETFDLLTPPEIVTVEVTVREVYEALKKNGFDHLREEWFSGDTGACVLGQAAWNLNVAASADHYEDISDKAYEKWAEVKGADTWEEYDNTWGADSPYAEAWSDYALDRQLNRWAVPKNSKWFDWAIEGDSTRAGIGSAIIYWNDKRDTSKDDQPYVLATYDDVAAMAYTLLKPHFDKTVTLLKYEYKRNS